jgi:hypothetical protein
MRIDYQVNAQVFIIHEWAIWRRRGGSLVAAFDERIINFFFY